MSIGDGTRSDDPPTDRSGSRSRLWVGLGIAGLGVVLVIGVTVTMLWLRREPPPAGLHAGDCVKFLPQTAGRRFEEVPSIPCDAIDARFRVTAVMTKVDDAAATKVCQQESKRVGHKLMLLFAGPRTGPGQAMCVETLTLDEAAPR